MLLRAHGFASGCGMADSSKMSSLKVNMDYTTFILHTNAHTVRGRPTLKDVERFWLESVQFASELQCDLY